MKVLLTLILTLGAAGAFAQTLLLPDLVTAKSNLSDRSIDRSTFPGRVLLRFSNGVANIGKGRTELRAGGIVNGKREVYQRIYYSNGSYYNRYAGTFVYHPEHGHTHFEDFAHYKLREVIGSTGVGDIVADSEKVSFCLYDEYVYNSSLPYFRNYRRYTSCSGSVQGISVGWKDVYGKSLAGQWIDVTNLPSDYYWLESTVDPLNRIRESNGSNNTTRIKIYLNND